MHLRPTVCFRPRGVMVTKVYSLGAAKLERKIMFKCKKIFCLWLSLFLVSVQTAKQLIRTSWAVWSSLRLGGVWGWWGCAWAEVWWTGGCWAPWTQYSYRYDLGAWLAHSHSSSPESPGVRERTGLDLPPPVSTLPRASTLRHCSQLLDRQCCVHV